MRVVLGSLFRDSAAYLPLYFYQLGDLRQLLAARGDILRLVLLYGDCQDDTAALLVRACRAGGYEALVSERSHGQESHGHVQSPLRMRELAWIGDGVLEALAATDEQLLYVESDLRWEAPALLRLLDNVTRPGVDVCVPMVMTGPNRFYDIWAYRKDGRQFTPQWPWHPALGREHADMVELDAAGSCLALNQAALRAAQEITFPTWDVWPGMCRQLRERGYHVWLDTTVTIQHPR